MRRPFCLMAQTIGPFGWLAPWFRRTFRRAAFITARDRETLDTLARWNLAVPLDLTADVAFLLAPAPRETAVAVLKQSGHDAGDGQPLVAVTPSNLHNVRKTQSKAGDTTTHPVLEQVAAGLLALHKQTKCRLLIVPHVFGPGTQYDDRRAASALRANIASVCQPIVVDQPHPAPVLKALLSMCDIFISMRMHAMIGATSQCVPTAAVAYSPKFVALAARLGLDAFATPLYSAEPDAGRFERLFLDLWQARERMREQLRQAMAEEILPAARRNFDILATAMEEQTADRSSH
jgi:polysaccharide pyruvyl transferase WcaK-like protein